MPHINDPLLQAYIDGFCGEARVAEIEAHLAECAECSERLERARGAAARASQLLGSLEPGPIHEPSFEELKERAVARSNDSGIDPMAALELARAATAKGPTARPPLWRRPGLAWAATVLIAFAVGWLTRSGVDVPRDLEAPASFAAQPPGSRFDGRNEAAGELAGRASPAESEAFRQRVAEDERDDAEAAKVTSADNVAPPQAPAPEPAAAAAPARVNAEGQELPSTAVEETVARREVASVATAEQRQAAAVEQQPLAVTGQDANVNFSRRAQLGGLLADADAPVTPGFVVIDLADVEPWLGAPPRELREAALLRVEVGPGELLDNGVTGRNAVRLTYWARGGEEIVLTQQYVGPEWRPAPADELPAVFSDPGGPATYTWLDDGYVLSISAMLEPEIVRQIAGLVR